MDVILLQRVAKLGQMGETVRVKNGYARNFLLPTGKALRATEANKKRFQDQKADLEARNLHEKSEASAVAEKLDGQSFIIVRQAGETGQLYGSVSARDVAEAVSAGGFKVSREQIELVAPMKTLGLHTVPSICIRKSRRRSRSTSPVRRKKPSARPRAKRSMSSRKPRSRISASKSARRWPKLAATKADDASECMSARARAAIAAQRPKSTGLTGRIRQAALSRIPCDEIVGS